MQIQMPHIWGEKKKGGGEEWGKSLKIFYSQKILKIVENNLYFTEGELTRGAIQRDNRKRL